MSEVGAAGDDGGGVFFDFLGDLCHDGAGFLDLGLGGWGVVGGEVEAGEGGVVNEEGPGD